ncbi:MAG: alanine racemase, partial [Planctomycetota bacterium]
MADNHQDGPRTVRSPAARRGARLRKVVRMESYLTAHISASAIRTNLSLLREQIGPAVDLCAVVKANCYGHGLDLLLDVLTGGADCLAVATPEEAIHLRELGYQGPILMFFSACAYADGQELRDALAELIARRVTLTVVAPPEVDTVAQAARRVGRTADVHVKIDTGMSRSGVMPHDGAELIA